MPKGGGDGRVPEPELPQKREEEDHLEFWEDDMCFKRICVPMCFLVLSFGFGSFLVKKKKLVGSPGKRMPKRPGGFTQTGDRCFHLLSAEEVKAATAFHHVVDCWQQRPSKPYVFARENPGVLMVSIGFPCGSRTLTPISLEWQIMAERRHMSTREWSGSGGTFGLRHVRVAN